MTGAATSPRILTVPGLGCSGPGHWQTLWEQRRGDCRRVELPGWDDPDPRRWTAALDEGVAGVAAPVVIAAHSLGCHAVARWLIGKGQGARAAVSGVLLVAPPDVEAEAVDPRIARFAPAALAALALPAILVASHDDPYSSFGRSVAMARGWNARLEDVGYRGHINAASALGDWAQGQALADELLREPAITTSTKGDRT